MINLLPYDMKSKISAARANSILLRYIIVLVISVVFIALASLAVYMINQSTIDKINASSNTSLAVNFNDSELKRADEYIKELKSYQTNVIANEIHYSTIINSISSNLPNGVIIDQIELSAEKLKNPIKLTIYATSMDLLNSVTSSLPKDTFTNISITEQKETTPIYSKYNYIGILNLTISKDLKL